MTAQFPTPPATVTDEAGRRITLRESGPEDQPALVELYANFDPADRAQGLPPTTERAIAEWLETILPTGVDVVAVAETIIGHATLVPGPEDPTVCELAIFVAQSYQNAGVGRALLSHLLGAGTEHGVEAVWLTVERWNQPAIALYETVGFEQIGRDGFELEMERTLAPQTDNTG